MKNRLLAILGAFLITASFCLVSQAADFSSIEGTYVMESRTLPDGTVLTPPAVVGLYTMDDGYVNFNLAVKHSDGKVWSRSDIATYSISGSTYTEEHLYTAINDGTGMKHDFTKRSGSSEMVMSEGNVELEFPVSGKIFGSFGPNSLTAMKSGVFIDKWVKVK